MKLERALSIIGLDRLPKDEAELNAVYRELAKKLHPDAGGSEAAFQELGEAVEYLKRALLLLNQRVQTKTRTEDALARKRAILREQMLRRRAEEDRLRNQQAQKWTIGLVVVLAIVGLWFMAQPKINHWMIERNRVERMAEVIRLDNQRTYTIEWTYKGKRFEKDINGRFIDGSWIVGPAGMPMLPGAKFVVAFNAEIRTITSFLISIYIRKPPRSILRLLSRPWQIIWVPLTEIPMWFACTGRCWTNTAWTVLRICILGSCPCGRIGPTMNAPSTP